MLDIRCKKCKRAGEKLFLKGQRCYSAKCPMVRKASTKLVRRKLLKHPRRGLSEYGLQQRKKQEVKFGYGLREKQFSNYVKEATRKKTGDRVAKLYEFLETRLDNAIFKMGLADSRSVARQIVSHGHIQVNNRKVNMPSYRMKVGDKIFIRPQSFSKGIFKDIDIKLKKYNPPSWIKLDKEKKMGEVVGLPLLSEDPGMVHSLNSIIEFYSR